MNRRDILKMIGTTGAIGSVSVGGVAAAEARGNSETSNIDTVSTEATKSAASNAIQTPLAQRIIAEFSSNQHSVQKRLKDATQIKGLVDDTVVVNTVSIPTTFGKLDVHYHKGEAFKAISRLDTENLQNRFNWEIAESGSVYVFSSGKNEPITGTREISEENVPKSANGVGEKPRQFVETATLKKKSSEHSTSDTKGNKSKIWIVDDSTIHSAPIDEPSNTTPITSGATIQASCKKELFNCGIALATAAPTCALMGVGCAATGVMSLPCAVAIIHTCAPQVAINLPSCTGISSCL